MKILTCCLEYPPIGGGGAKVVQGLTDELAQRGHSVDIVTMHYKTLSLYEHRGKVTLYRVPTVRRKRFICSPFEIVFYIFRAIPTAVHLARSKQYHINHTHFIFPDGVIAWILFKKTGLPYVITVHGSDVPGYNPHRFTLLHAILAPVWKRVVAQARCIICPSRALEILVHKAFPDARTKVIPNGFDCSRFNPDRGKKKTIVCVTRMLERKGVQYLLQALQGMDLADTEVHIVGDGPYLPRLKQIAAETGVRAVFHGFMNNDSTELKSLLEEAGIFVFTSEAENFPIVLLEAMAAGAAIITTKGTGCEEVVGDTAVLVEPKNADALQETLRRLLFDTEQCRRLGQAARKRLENHYSLKNITSDYIKIYEKESVSVA